MNQNVPTGSISSGTLNPNDLISAFCTFLKRYANESYNEVLVNWAEDIMADEDCDSAAWADMQVDLLERLEVALEELSPKGYYFGIAPGDGADYGFWRAEIGP